MSTNHMHLVPGNCTPVITFGNKKESIITHTYRGLAKCQAGSEWGMFVKSLILITKGKIGSSLHLCCLLLSVWLHLADLCINLSLHAHSQL